MFNQFDEHYSVNELASKVQSIYSETYGKTPEIRSVPNPRLEAEEHYYNPAHEKLAKLGYTKSKELGDELRIILRDLRSYRRRIEKLKEVINPRTIWKDSPTK